MKNKKTFGNYIDSVRTSGEVENLFFRTKVVLYKLEFFIEPNLLYILI